jgi:hypothetical protein
MVSYSESGNVKDVIRSALEIKNDEHFKTCRSIIREIDNAYNESGMSAGNKKVTSLMKDLDKISGDIKRLYGVPSNQESRQFLIKTFNSISEYIGMPSIPETEFAISTPEFMKTKQHKAFSTVFKDITNELTSMERLGGLRDKLTSEFNLTKGTLYNGAKTENPIFRYSTSYWKKPM